MNINDIKDSYENPKTFANAKSLIHRVNKMLELKPLDYVHCHLYENEFSKLCDSMFSVGMAKSKKDVVYKLNQVVAIIKRFDVDKTRGLRDKIFTFDNSTDDIVHESKEQVVRPWSEMLDLLNSEIKYNLNRNARIACICFKHGYVINIKELYSTSTKIGSSNCLDLDGLKWTLNDHKNDHIGSRKFPVTQDFVDELQQHIQLKNSLLIYKSTFEPYGTSLLSSIGIHSFTNTELRDSYMNFIWSSMKNRDAAKLSADIIGYMPECIKRYEDKYPDVHTCDPHPLHLENPVKYSVNGRIKVIVTRKI